MADDTSAPPPAAPPTRPSWKQVGALIFAGVILVPGLCIALAASSNTMDSAVTIMFALLALSILLTAIGAVLGIIRIVKDVRRR